MLHLKRIQFVFGDNLLMPTKGAYGIFTNFTFADRLLSHTRKSINEELSKLRIAHSMSKEFKTTG